MNSCIDKKKGLLEEDVVETIKEVELTEIPDEDPPTNPPPPQDYPDTAKREREIL